MGVIRVNGKTFEVPDNANISIVNDEIRVNGELIGDGSKLFGTVKIDLTGSLVSLNCHSPLTMTGDILGDATIDGPATIRGNIMKNVKVDGPLTVNGDIHGNAKVDGPCSCKSIGGKLK